MLVDQAVSRFRGEAVDVVIAIGGGSVLDAAKAIAGLLPHGNSVMDHLEGVGKNIPYHGPSTPFIAVPTTAGTGSEATKNSVLSVQGPDGFKKSFRDECLIPEYAVIDPDLLASCPRELVAADGMDAFTQLLESYVSLKANPFIDALAWSGMSAVKEGFFAAWEGNEPAAAMAAARWLMRPCFPASPWRKWAWDRCMAWPRRWALTFLSRTASSAARWYLPPPRSISRPCKQREPENPALAKYAQVGRLLTGRMSLMMLRPFGVNRPVGRVERTAATAAA